MPQFRTLVTELAIEVDKDPELKKLSLGGYARTHKEMDNDLMATAAKAGFKWLSIGVESGTPKILELIEKRQNSTTSFSNLLYVQSSRCLFNTNPAIIS